MANLAKEELENIALSTFARRPRLCYRFVDDTIAALKKTEIHEHLKDPNVHIIHAWKYKQADLKSLPF